MRKYGEDDDWNWKLRVALLFILGHMIILVLPFFSVIFLLMDILGEGSSPGHIYGNHYNALLEMGVLILLILTFFMEMVTITIAPQDASVPFGKLVLGEVVLLGVFIFMSYDAWGHQRSNNAPLGIVMTCTVVKICCGVWRESVESARYSFLKRGSSKIV